MTLEDLGYNNELEAYRQENQLTGHEVGRVIAEHKERYIVKTALDEFDAEIIGNLRFTARDRTDFPAVGDWVAFSEYDENKGLIHSIFPRKSLIERQAVGKIGEKQIIAANIDYALLVQAVDRDYNLNRLERYLTLCHTSRIEPVIILTKIDLISEEELQNILQLIKDRIADIAVIAISNETQEGYDSIHSLLKTGHTYCLLGSSGVGKSSLMNNLTGKDLMKTGAISTSTNKGKHVTSHRELMVLEQGGLLIDNPGMREVGIADSESGLEITFNTIAKLAEECKFKDCTHSQESDCAVLEAIERGEIDREAFENYMKMEKEREHYSLSVLEKRQKDKDFGKMVKDFQKKKKYISNKHNNL